MKPKYENMISLTQREPEFWDRGLVLNYPQPGTDAILSALHILTLGFGKSWEIITCKRKASFLLGVRTLQMLSEIG